MIKRLVIAIILLTVVVGGLVGFNRFRDQAIENFFANMPVAVVSVSTVEAKAGKWTPVIEAIGSVRASQGVDLTVEATGIVTSLNFTANQKVSQGDMLVQLDDSIQRADLEAAKAQANLDRQTLARTVELRDRQVGSNVALQAAEAAAAASAAQVERLEAALRQKQLRAPFDGTIGIPRINEGQYLSPGVAVATLQDLSRMYADFTVPEQTLGLLSIGQKIRATVEGEDEEFAGEIIGIDPKVDPASRLVSVRAEVENDGGKLVPGQFARVHVIQPDEENIISLPQTAIVTSLYGDYVYVVHKAEGDEEKLEARQVFVEVGRRSGAGAEIREGVSEGDVIVTAGQNRLNNGSVVQIDNTLNPANGFSGSNQAAQQ